MKVLITGATGFIGKACCERALSSGCEVLGAVRSRPDVKSLPVGIEEIRIQSIVADTCWAEALIGVSTVIHLAARVHVMNEADANPLTSFREINVAGTEHLARMAAASGVKRFIYMSSVKVNGEETELRTDDQVLNFSEKDVPSPQDPYGISKWEAEQVLREIESETSLEVVTLRAPLVYGPGVKANFLRLLKLTKLGLPLPLGSLNNQRSMIYIGNLVDAITTCLKHPKAAGETFLVSDGEEVSTTQLIKMIASSMGKKSRLLPFPPAMLNMLGKLTGKSAEVERLTNSLQVDSSKIRTMLGWKPPFTMDEGIKETVNWYMNQR